MRSETQTPKPTPTPTAKPVATPTPAPAGTQTAKPATTPTATPAPKPRRPLLLPHLRMAAGRACYFTEKGARLIIYQPQVATWTDQVQMVAYSAALYTPRARPSRRSAPSS